MAATAIDFSTEKGAKARDHILYLVRNPDARIQKDGTGSVISIPSAGGVNLIEVSIYETEGTAGEEKDDTEGILFFGAARAGPKKLGLRPRDHQAVGRKRRALRRRPRQRRGS